MDSELTKSSQCLNKNVGLEDSILHRQTFASRNMSEELQIYSKLLSEQLTRSKTVQ
jgi:hypothetical protein